MRLRALYLLQLLDSKDAEFQREISRLKEPTANMKALSALLAGRKEREKVWRETEAALKDHQLALSSLESKIQAQEKKLVGGSITNAREAQDMENHIASLKRDREKRDEDVLVLMEEDDALKSELAAIDAQRRKLEQDIASEQKFIDEEIVRFEELLTQVRSRRDEVAEAIDEDQMDTYQKLRKRKAGLALVELKLGACGGCGVTLPDVIASQVRDDEEIIQCPNCERILVVDEENLAGRLLSR